MSTVIIMHSANSEALKETVVHALNGTDGQVSVSHTEENSTISTLVYKLQEGVAVFAYRKKDGSTRIAIGTNNEALLKKYLPDEKEGLMVPVKEAAENLLAFNQKLIGAPEILQKDPGAVRSHMALLEDAIKAYDTPVEKKERAKSETSHAYFDLSVGEWRSFVVSNFLFCL